MMDAAESKARRDAAVRDWKAPPLSKSDAAIQGWQERKAERDKASVSERARVEAARQRRRWWIRLLWAVPLGYVVARLLFSGLLAFLLY